MGQCVHSYGDVRVKLSRSNGHILHVAPEYDDCRKLAVEKQVPLQQVISEALRSYKHAPGRAQITGILDRCKSSG